MRRLLFIIFIFSSTGYSQNFLEGQVLDFDSNEALENVIIVNSNTKKWAISDEDGKFKLKLDSDNFTIEFQLLGKETIEITPADISSYSNFKVYLKDDNLRLDEVNVTAIPKRSKIGSAIVLDEYAINQIQSYSLSDVLNQLPGQTITAPSLNSANTISLRTAQPSTTNAFGVSYILDGMQLSNDENMQTYNLGGLTDYDNTNSGIDLRTIPASNIDEIEVISGIPDAKYGNLTSGLIKINRKAGVTPLSVSANIRDGNTSLSLNKGILINKKLGNLSFSLDYLNANADPRNSLEQYERITASAIWSVYDRKQSIKNTLSITAHNNLDDTNYDKDNDDGGKDAKYKKDRGIRINNRFSWQPTSGFIDQLSASIGYSYTYQHSYSQSFKNDGGRVVPTSLETGLFSASYTPVAYLQIREVYGQPINFNISGSISKNFEFGKTEHSFSTGINFTHSDNKGKGKAYDPENAHTQVTLSGNGTSASSGEGIRPLNFDRYVDPRKNIGIYFQDNITLEYLNNRKIYGNIGLRYDIQNGFSSISPRFNLGIELSTDFSIRGGLGFASKAPSLAQIFPGDKFFDILIRDFRTADYSYNLVQTYRKDIPKQNLEPVKSWKYEVGLNYNLPQLNISLTGYYNRTFDAIASYNSLDVVDFPEVSFDFPYPELPPDYTVTGYSPLILDYNLNKNANSTIDKGIELFLRIKKIKSINTSFNIVGSYTYTSSSSEIERVIQNTDPLEEEFLYGFYGRRPDKNDILRLRGTITHHISNLGLLISLTAEQFTRSKSFASISSRYPYAYLNPNGERIEISGDEDKYSSLWLNPASSENIITPTYHNFHLRITKELLNGLSTSLYANNFLDYHPLIRVGSQESRQNGAISFGAQIQYKF